MPLRCTAVAIGLLAIGVLPPASARLAADQNTAPIFQFRVDGMWLNLHSFLYVLSRDAAEMPDRTRSAVAMAPGDQNRGLATLDEARRESWRDAVRTYGRGLGRLDAIFDESLVEATNALVRAGSGPLDSPALNDETRAALERAAPIYRAVWWPRHREANQAWVGAVTPALERHGAEVLAFITQVYGEAWPEAGYPVNVSSYANWAGAYSTAGNLLVVSSLAPTVAGMPGLEITFHEAMHQWDSAIDRALAAASRTVGVEVPGDLSHAMIFYTAGEAVRRAVPGYVPYAEVNGMWGRRMGAFKPALDEAWLPWLDGTGTREAALVGILEHLRDPASR